MGMDGAHINAIIIIIIIMLCCAGFAPSTIALSCVPCDSRM